MPEWTQIAIRSVSIIIGLFIITKLLGKKQLSKLSFFEYIVGITVGDIAGTLSMDYDLDISNGVTSILIWTLTPLLIGKISLKNKTFRNFVEGNSTVFIQNGKVLEENLSREKYTADELLEQLRKKDVFKLADVEFATLEANGDLSVLLKKPKQPVRVEDLFSTYVRDKEPYTVIMDGMPLEKSMKTSGFTISWIQTQLEQKGYRMEDVFLGQIDYTGRMYLDLYDDVIPVHSMDQDAYLAATLKRCEAQLEWLAIVYPEYKQLYNSIQKDVQKITDNIVPYLRKV
ncbi:DUF421 domain-containing protein [Metabacillus iocasae]|uniref:Uncharacterized membrane protein YcaP (DUF421 family) n=1 Tax=Priestia iocasae TaxID=2291674 RepID=A0ABS2QU63_9BACI|nr:DUF421 domain-containing protein [Metabacillus iocasae]MBM7702532.1 uncharacterized membrane protein YcaP (DUF421 family) [Metabacillus iocasae]